MNDTIAAISTALGEGAISIIRVSGKDAIKITNKIFTSDLTKKESHTINYGYIKDKKEVIDEVLISIMKAPKTFTTEDIVEINCHGGVTTTKKVLELLLENGCRLAEPGEFTKRAFLNGRIDLTKAEAVSDLINVKSENARKLAIRNLQGKTTNKIKELRTKLIDIISNIEVNMDYPEYLDIEIVTKQKINKELKTIKEDIDKIIENSKNSKIINNGINVAIIGRPNVGKSSILNILLQEEKAIVTDIPGTTRDIVEGSINLDGNILNLIDTAGIRTSSDVVEQIGVNKSLKQIEEADLIILVLNNNEELTKEDKELLDLTKTKKRIIVINKNDLEPKLKLPKQIENIVYTNTITEEGITNLKTKIKEMFDLGKIDYNDYTYLSNLNSIKTIEKAKKSLNDAEKALKNKENIDLIEIDLKTAWQLLGEIIGETYSEELLDNLFKNFCVGK